MLVGVLASALVATVRGSPIDRLVGVQLAATVQSLVLVALAMASGRTSYLDVALVATVVSLAGTLSFARFLGRWG